MPPQEPENLTGQPTLFQEIVALAWPAVLQGVLSTIILFTDRLILGQYSDSALASMQVCGPVLWSVFSLFGAYSVGVLAVIGRSVGEQDYDRAARTMGSAVVIALVLGTLVGCIGALATPTLTSLIIGDGVVQQASTMANQYLFIVFLSGPLMMLSSVTFVAFQASGDTKTPMWLTGMSGAVNLLLSWLLVFGHLGLPELGILGAAIGTVGASVCNAIGGLLAMYWLSSPLRPKAPVKRAFQSIFKIAWPAFGEKLLFHTGFLIFAGYVGRLGEKSMTAHQAMMAIESLGYIGAHGFGIATGALVAQKLGANKPDEAIRAGVISAKLSTIVLCCIGLFFYVFAEPLISVFTDNPLIIQEGVRCMTIAAVAQPLMALTDVFAGALRGAGDTKTPMQAAIAGPLIIRLSACWCFAFYLDWGLWGIWVGSTLDWSVRALWLGMVFFQKKWTSIVV